jgi:acetyl-CoA acyltransferase
VTINRFCSSGLQAIAHRRGRHRDRRERHRRRGRRRVDDDGADDGQQALGVARGDASGAPSSTRRWASRRRTSPSASASRAPIKTRSRYRSQQKAAAAREGGKVRRRDRRRSRRRVRARHAEVDDRVHRDELVRADTTLEGLAALKPAFIERGSVTAGNASPLSDGAAAALVMSKAKADALGIKPLGYFRAFATRASIRRSWASGPSRRCASCSPRRGSR